jgi:hypothetical protein
MRPLCFFSLLARFIGVLGMEFINPSPLRVAGDFTLNPVYFLGSTIDVQWTAGPEGILSSLTMFQLNVTTEQGGAQATQCLEPFELLDSKMMFISYHTMCIFLILT